MDVLPAIFKMENYEEEEGSGEGDDFVQWAEKNNNDIDLTHLETNT